MPTDAMIRICDEIEREDEAAGGAKALEGGDHAALAVEIGADGIGDPHPAHHKRGEADQGEELREALDVGGKCGCRVGARADAPSRFRKLFRRLGAERGEACFARAIRQPYLVDVLDQAAGLDQAGGAQSFQ